MVGLNNYFYDAFGSMKQSDPENSLKAQFVIFRCQKYVKKGYKEMGEQFYLELLKTVPGRSARGKLGQGMDALKKGGLESLCESTLLEDFFIYFYLFIISFTLTIDISQ